jgi:hypothetical protein
MSYINSTVDWHQGTEVNHGAGAGAGAAVDGCPVLAGTMAELDL